MRDLVLPNYELNCKPSGGHSVLTGGVCAAPLATVPVPYVLSKFCMVWYRLGDKRPQRHV